MVAGAAEALIFFAKIWPLERYLPTLIPVKMAILIAMTGLFQMLVPRIPDVVLKLGKKLAASSYTLYILHFPVLLLIFALTWEHYTAFQASAKALFLTATFITVWFLCHAAARYLEDRRRWAWLFGGAAR
jgi:peptidoglycan/LPS O-acetylase OafA/YrhL